jgi:hypothetical protein
VALTGKEVSAAATAPNPVMATALWVARRGQEVGGAVARVVPEKNKRS